MSVLFFVLNYIKGEYHLKDWSRKSENNPKLVPATARGFIKNVKRVKPKNFDELSSKKALPELTLLRAETAHKGDNPDCAYFWHVIATLRPVFAAKPTSITCPIIIFLINPFL